MSEALETPTTDSAEKAYAAAAESVTVAPPAESVPAPREAGPVVEAPATVTKAPAKPKKAVAKPAPVVASPAVAPEAVNARKVAAKPAAAPVKPLVAKKSVAKKPVAKKAPDLARPAAKPAPKPASKTNPLTAIKEKIMPAKKTADFTKTIKTVAADVQAKAKLVYAKGAELAGEAGEFTKGNVDAIVASGKILGAGMQDMGKSTFAEGKTAMETLKTDIKGLTSVKSPVEFVRLHTSILRRNIDQAFELGGKNTEAAIKLAGDAIAPLSARAELAVAKFKKAA